MASTRAAIISPRSAFRRYSAAPSLRPMMCPVAVISYALWQQRFGGSGSIVGAPLVVERVPFTIIGVTPPSFFGTEVGRTFDLALPINTEPLIPGRPSRIDRASGFY